MNYWWVSQNQSYKEEFEGGYMWSPKLQKDGKTNNSYENMTRVSPGDIVFSFKSTKLYSIGVIQSKGYSCPRPNELSKDAWATDGWKVDVEYTPLNKRIRPKDHIESLRASLPEKYSPLKSDGDGNQSYLFQLPIELTKKIVNLIGSEANKVINDSEVPEVLDEDDNKQQEIVNDPDISVTEKQQLVKSRKGQGIFRRRLEAIEHECRVTKTQEKKHLIASHIKPWCKSSNYERLDGNNGLLLAPHIDHLFDKGYISFRDNGKLIMSKQLCKQTLILWSVENKNYGAFRTAQLPYLKFHRENIFKK
ncbi:HNH endonuclease signature motif containing protein [Vibrio chagasii]|uniref:HNH endonuclease n=1 Tax=Vibrio chagasii TaxID=170679 RepID=UPI0038CDC493